MPTFRNLNDYFNYANNKLIKPILSEIADKTLIELKNTVQEKLYDSYTPKLYERTYELLDSISKTKVYQEDGFYKVKIFYDTDKIFPHIRSAKEGYNAHALWDGTDISDSIPFMVEYEYPYGEYKTENGIHAIDDVKDWINREFNKLFIKKLKEKGIKCK